MTSDFLIGRTELADGHIADLGEAEIWYHDSGGEGEPIVLCGSFTGGHFLFDFVRPYLEGYRLLAWAPRGTGPSKAKDPEASEYSAAIWADDLKALLDHLEVPRAHLWSNGFGSYIALRFAAAHPQAVGALVASSDVWAADPSRGYKPIWEVLELAVKNFGTKGLGANFITGWYAVTLPDIPWFGQWDIRCIEDICHAETFSSVIGYGMLEADVRADLPKVEAPTLIFQGDLGRDPKSDGQATMILEQVPRSDIHILENAHGGYMLVQRPADCAAVASEFFERHPLAVG